MKRKLFWTTFLTLITFTLIVFVVDRFYFLSQIESHAQRELETIASTIIASDLSLEVLNKFETTDDIISDLIDDERAEIRAGLVEIERGEVANDDEVRAAYKRIGV